MELKLNFFREHSAEIGFGASALAEIAWQTVLEPKSPYNNPGDNIGRVEGLMETGIGAGLAYLLTEFTRKGDKK